MEIRDALNSLVKGDNLSMVQMRSVMMQVMTGRATNAQIGAFLVALRIKGESVDEITGAAEIMRELTLRVEVDQHHLVDIVGTGGDGANLFNVSTAAAFVAAAAGARVAKHGNRSVSSSSGSSDVLEALGVRLNLTSEHIAECINRVGLGFMYAPAHHEAMKHAIGPRRELGIRSLFNILGPLTNPALVKRQVLGVFESAFCQPVATVLENLGSIHALVLHSDDGLDEISVAATTRGWELIEGELKPFLLHPAKFGHAHPDLRGLEVGSPESSSAIIRSVLEGSSHPAIRKANSMIALNAGAAIYVSGIAPSLSEGVSLAETVIESGQALDCMHAFISFTQNLSKVELKGRDE